MSEPKFKVGETVYCKGFGARGDVISWVSIWRGGNEHFVYTVDVKNGIPNNRNRIWESGLHPARKEESLREEEANEHCLYE